MNLIVLSGGPSPEHEVSLNTGKMVLASLDKKKYNVRPAIITKEREWKFQQGDKQIVLDTAQAIPELRKADAVFVAMHGTFGEDGRIQGLLEFLQIPYTGSGVLASALAMDKLKAIEIFSRSGLKVPQNINFSATDWQKNKKNIIVSVLKNIKIPCVIKPVDSGSSVGVAMVKEKTALEKAIENSLKCGRRVMAEQFIKGDEVTCGVIEESGKPRALPPTQIIPKTAEFFDYQAKYTAGASEEITPAKLPKKIIQEIQANALKAHHALGCRGMSRTDMIVSKNGIYILEINTIPGMTKTSLLPQAAAAAGISFPELLDKIIRAALE